MVTLRCDCGKKLRKKRGKENVFYCECGCAYRLVIVKKCNKCGNIGKKLSLKEIRKRKRNKRKRK